MTATPKPTPKPEDLSEAIAACKSQCDRLGIDSHDISVMLWLENNSFNDWCDIDRPGFIRLYRFLVKCQPFKSKLPTPRTEQKKNFVYWPALQRKVEVLAYEGDRAQVKLPETGAIDWVNLSELQR